MVEISLESALAEYFKWAIWDKVLKYEPDMVVTDSLTAVNIVLPHIELDEHGGKGIYDYADAVPTKIDPLTLVFLHWENDGPTEAKYILSAASKTTSMSEFDWGLNEEIDYGVEVEGKINIPFVAGTDITFTKHQKIGTHKNWGQASVQEWSVGQQWEVPVPAHSILFAEFTINQARFEGVDFKIRMTLSGTASATVTWNGHLDAGPHPAFEHTWNLSENITKICQDRSDLFSSFTIVDSDTVVVELAGKFNGTFGTDSRVRTWVTSISHIAESVYAGQYDSKAMLQKLKSVVDFHSKLVGSYALRKPIAIDKAFVENELQYMKLMVGANRKRTPVEMKPR
jgi:hypothetical protein